MTYCSLGSTVSNNYQLPQPFFYKQMNCLDERLINDFTVSLKVFLSLVANVDVFALLLARLSPFPPVFLLVFVWFHNFSLNVSFVKLFFIKFSQNNSYKNKIKKQIYFQIISVIMMSQCSQIASEI